MTIFYVSYKSELHMGAYGIFKKWELINWFLKELEVTLVN